MAYGASAITVSSGSRMNQLRKAIFDVKSGLSFDELIKRDDTTSTSDAAPTLTSSSNLSCPTGYDQCDESLGNGCCPTGTNW